VRIVLCLVTALRATCGQVNFHHIGFRPLWISTKHYAVA